MFIANSPTLSTPQPDMFKITLALAAAMATSAAQAALITTYNNCPFTIWPGVYADPKTPAVGIGGEGGYQLNAYESKNFGVSERESANRSRRHVFPMTALTIACMCRSLTTGTRAEFGADATVTSANRMSRLATSVRALVA